MEARTTRAPSSICRTSTGALAFRTLHRRSSGLSRPNPYSVSMETFLGFVFVAIGVLVVVGFIGASAWNSKRYSESLQPPEDLRRADTHPDPTGGAPSGGDIWP